MREGEGQFREGRYPNAMLVCYHHCLLYELFFVRRRNGIKHAAIVDDMLSH